MICAEFKELVPLMALGALTHDEQVACDAHLAEPRHEGCREALEEARRVTDLLGDAVVPVRPRAEVWSAIERGIAAESAPRATSTWGRYLPWLVVAVMLLAILFIDGGRRRLAAQLDDSERAAATARNDAHQKDDERSRCAAELQAVRGELKLRAEAVALLELPSTRLVALAPQGGAASHASAVVNLEKKSGVVIVGGLVGQAGKDYELWVIQGNDKRAAGLLHADASGSTLVSIEPSLLARGADAFAVTLEPAGGGPAPRGPIVLVGAMPKT